MNSKNKLLRNKIFYSYSGDHIVHRKFAESVTSHHGDMNEGYPKNYDLYFTESKFWKVLLYRFFGRINRQSAIITLFSDPRLVYLTNRRYWDISKSKLVKYPFLKYWISIFLMRSLNGAICVGDLQGEMFKKLAPNVPMRVVYPFISTEVYDKLKNFAPSLNKNNLLFISNGPDDYNKGLDLLLESFKKVNKLFPRSKLTILGDWEVKEEWKIKNVYFMGKVKDISNYINDSSLCIHPSRGEAFGVSVIESMLAGIPVIVSEHTGSKSIVLKSGCKVVSLDSKQIVHSITQYFNSSLRDKKVLSKSVKNMAESFLQGPRVSDFKSKFLDLLEEIYEKDFSV